MDKKPKQPAYETSLELMLVPVTSAPSEVRPATAAQAFAPCVQALSCNRFYDGAEASTAAATRLRGRNTH